MGFSLKGALKGAIGGFAGGGGIGAIGGAIGGGFYEGHQESEAKKAQKKAQNWWKYQFNSANDFTREQMQNRIQWSVEDALKAGINPAVAAGAPSNVTGSAMPNSDLYGGINARANTMNAMTNEANSETARHAMRSQTMLNESNAYKNYTEAGLMDRNTAAREVQAHAAEMQAYTRAQEVDAVINRMNTLLPMEEQGMALDLAVKAYNNELTAREKRVLDRTGLTLEEWKTLGKEALDITKFAIGGKLAGGGKNSARNYSVDYYDRNGEVTGGKYIHYH